MMLNTMLSPKPVPLPGPLVVRNGSNTLSIRPGYFSRVADFWWLGATGAPAGWKNGEYEQLYSTS